MSATSPNNFKYYYFYNGDYIYGNSIDAIAQGVVKASNNTITFTKAVLEVQKNMIPVNKKVFQQIINKKVEEEKSLTLQEILAGAQSALKQMGGICETQEVINARAIICSYCPKKTDTSGCGPCGWAKKIKTFVNGIKKFWGGGHIIPNELDKSYCDVCKCALGMMLPAKISDFKTKTINDPERPKTCWMKKESNL